jgi:Rho GDP-dissociation inhibitor
LLRLSPREPVCSQERGSAINGPPEEQTVRPVRVVLLGFTLQVGYEEVPVPVLPVGVHVHGPPSPVVLREGTECRAVLTFRVTGSAVESLKVVDVWWKDGVEVARREVLLGDFRADGPYEVVLPAQRMPRGPGAPGLYEARVRMTDADDRIHAEQAYSFEIKRLLLERAAQRR